jgi:hypothetical protein
VAYFQCIPKENLNFYELKVLIKTGTQKVKLAIWLLVYVLHFYLISFLRHD